MSQPTRPDDPHQNQPIAAAGAPLENAAAVMIMLHGRGGTSDDILALKTHIDWPDFAYLAPQAAGGSWYPNSFMAPIGTNEPWLSSALETVDHVLSRATQAGIPPRRIMLFGFSQGACLALEYAARHARRYGGIIGLSGGLIGPDGTPRDYPGVLAGTPVFLGCSEQDALIPAGRVQLTRDVLLRLGGDVTMQLYPGDRHAINQDELDTARAMMAALAAQTQ